jgi:hypothetical protein
MSSPPPFRLRLRLPSSKQETLTLPEPVSIRTLLDAIQPHVNVDLSKIGLRLAYPPKPLDLGEPHEWDRAVTEIGITSGEALTVTVDCGGQPPPQTTETKPVVTAPTTATTFSGSKRPSTEMKSHSPPKRGRGNVSMREEPPEIPVEGGTVVLRVMEDDNSCMYVSPPFFL